MSKTILIAYRHGGIVPAAVTGKPADLKVAAHEAVEVPFAYGRSLVDDRFAYEVERERPAGKSKGKASEASAKPDLAALEAAIVAAKAKVADADLVGKEAAEAELTAAEAVLAAALAG